MSEVLNLLQRRIEEEKKSRQIEFKDMNGEIEGLLKQFQVLSLIESDWAKLCVFNMNVEWVLKLLTQILK